MKLKKALSQRTQIEHLRQEVTLLKAEIDYLENSKIEHLREIDTLKRINALYERHSTHYVSLGIALEKTTECVAHVLTDMKNFDRRPR